MREIEGQIVDLFAGRIFPGVIKYADGLIVEITELSEAADHYIMPGFVDAHVHIESSMLVPSEFSKLAVRHGTVATVSDPHEIANVLGVPGVKFMIENAAQVPFHFFFGAPSCVPATSFETAGAEINVTDIIELLSWPEIRYLAEMMNYPGVLHADPQVIAKIDAAKQAGKPIDGHAPGLQGQDAKDYIQAGISTDHECFTYEEAKYKLENGMKILIRDGSAAKNFDELIPLLAEFPDRIMFCSDDKHPDNLVEGHINQLAARAVVKGHDIINILRATCLNPVLHYNLPVGLVREGDAADFIVVQDLQEFVVKTTVINGDHVFENNVVNIASVPVPEINQFNRTKIKPEQIELAAESKIVRTIVVEDGQLITTSALKEAILESGKLQSNPAEDVLKIVLVNRYENAEPAVAFVSNFGLKKGALASTVAHDSHNIIAVGVDDDDIVSAINALIDCKGGISCANEHARNILPLPIAGLMSAEDGYVVAEKYEVLDQEVKSFGSSLSAPFMTLSFCALLVIPELKLSDLGLFDGNLFKFTSISPDKIYD